jgi:hypothetical protein
MRQLEDMTAATVPATGVQIGYARVSTGHQSLDQQLDGLTAAGVDPKRVYSDKLSGASTREQRPGLAALLDYARPGDALDTSATLSSETPPARVWFPAETGRCLGQLDGPPGSR